MRVDDVDDDPRYVALRHDLRSELCVPLRFGRSVLGVLNVESRSPSAYDDSDRRLLEIVAAQLAVSVRAEMVGRKSPEELLAICSFRKRIRDDEGRWHMLERFLDDRLGLIPSHGICPDCAVERRP